MRGRVSRFVCSGRGGATTRDLCNSSCLPRKPVFPQEFVSCLIMAFDGHRRAARARPIADLLIMPVDVPSVLHYSLTASVHDMNSLRVVIDGMIDAKLNKLHDSIGDAPKERGIVACSRYVEIQNRARLVCADIETSWVFFIMSNGHWSSKPAIG